MTEEEVEGIYFEHLHKIETVPGYAEAFKRMYELMRKVMNEEPVDQKELDEAMVELWLIDREQKHQ